MSERSPREVLIAALADDGDRRKLLGVGYVGHVEHDRGLRLLESKFDAAVGFAGERLFDRGQYAQRPRLEHGLRRRISRIGIARKQRERAQGRVDGSTQPVVDVDVIEIGRRVAGDRVSRRGGSQLTGFILDVDRLAFGAEHQPADFQVAEDKFGARAAAAGDVAYADFGLIEIICGKMRKRLVEARGVCGRDAKRGAEGQ